MSESAFEDDRSPLLTRQNSGKWIKALEAKRGFARIAKERKKFGHPFLRRLRFMDEITPLSQAMWG